MRRNEAFFLLMKFVWEKIQSLLKIENVLQKIPLEGFGHIVKNFYICPCCVNIYQFLSWKICFKKRFFSGQNQSQDNSTDRTNLRTNWTIILSQPLSCLPTGQNQAKYFGIFWVYFLKNLMTFVVSRGVTQTGNL